MNITQRIISLVAALSATAIAQPANRSDVPHPNTPFLPDLTPGYVVIEHDIQVRLDQYLAMIHGGSNDATFGDVEYWPGGVVPFDFVTSGPGAVSAARQVHAATAMAMIEQRTGVDFRPATGSDTSRIRFQNSNFNNSPVGRQGGTQIVNIFNWTLPIIVCHELYHSLGYWHEQSRPDRDESVIINLANICGSSQGASCTPSPTGCCGCTNSQGSCVSCAFNFEVHANAAWWGPYDFDSFMHYGRADFSCNGQDTITVREPNTAQWQNSIGQIDHFSHLDELSCRGIYPKPGDRWLRAGAGGFEQGTFFSPYTSIISMYAAMPTGGTLFVDPGTYNIPVVGAPQSLPITIRATYGPVTITSHP